MLSAAPTNRFVGAATVPDASTNRFVGAATLPTAPLCIFPPKKFKLPKQCFNQIYMLCRAIHERHEKDVSLSNTLFILALSQRHERHENDTEIHG